MTCAAPRSQPRAGQSVHPDIDPAQGAVFRRIRERAAAADRGETDLAPDLAAMHRAGMLSRLVDQTACGGHTRAAVSLLRRIGRASLPVGRILEGHANALRLVQLFGSSAQQDACRVTAASGGIFGVWGADGRDPVTIAAIDGPHVVLGGTKQFCSGLGLLTVAVVPVQTDAGPLLFLAEVGDPDRADLSSWQVSGMKATASGRYDLSGVRAETLGRAGDFLREPHFEGGIWRYCALHCGGLEALAEAVRQHILSRGQSNDPQQAERLAHIVTFAHTARLWVEAFSADVERAAVTGYGIQTAVAHGLLGREAVEQACQAGIALAERAIGTAAFATPSEVDRVRRDLGFFLRQARLDSKLAAATRTVLDHALPVGEMW